MPTVKGANDFAVTSSGPKLKMTPFAPTAALAGCLEKALQAVCRNGVGNSARSSEGCFLRSLDEHHVDHGQHFAGGRIVNRTAAVARISGRIELEHRESAARQAADQLRIEVACARLRDRDRRDGGHHAAMRCRKRTEYGTYWEPGKQNFLTFLDAIRIADLQRREPRALYFDERQIGFRIHGHLLGFTPLSLVTAVSGLSRDKDRQDLLMRGIEHFRQNVGVGCDQCSVSDGETGTEELKLGRSCALEELRKISEPRRERS